MKVLNTQVSEGARPARSGRNFAILAAAVLGGFAAHAGEIPAAGLREQISDLADNRQLIVVRAGDWGSVDATLECFERATAGAPWKQALAAITATVGRNGMAWGIGLHGSCPPGGVLKIEGDGRAPAGVFLLHSVFGYAKALEAQILKFPYQALSETSAGVDDPDSRYYNRIIDATEVSRVDWKSAEVMLRKTPIYRWGIFVEHNWKPFPGYGSCIFMHTWIKPGKGTAGCTGMSAEHIERVARWLDHERKPLLVQLPAVEYERLRAGWRLP